MKNIFLLLVIFLSSFAANANVTISIKDIDKHIGETVTICDFVYTTRSLTGLTLINLGTEFPKQLLTVVIYKADLSKFTELDKTYLTKKVGITGKLGLYNNKPQIVVNEQKQMVSRN